MALSMPTPTPRLERKSKLKILTEAALKKAEEDELDPDLNLDFDPTKPSLEATATAGNSFSLPWSHEVRAILAGLDSTRLKEPGGPWVLDTPFDMKLVRLSTVIPDTIREGIHGVSTTGYYRDGLSTTSESTTEHLSASLGVTVGYPFLSAGATGEYDRRVSEDRNGVKASRHTTCRVGRVLLENTPEFSEEAKAVLQSGPGAEKRFMERYGDFYISGFVLGADAGACLSASTEAKSLHQRLKITVKVKVLFLKKEFKHEESKDESSESSSISFNGYSTLDDEKPYSVTLAGGTMALAEDQKALHEQARRYLDKVGGLHHKVGAIIKELGLADGVNLPLSDCTRLCTSGLVVELILSPFARLNKYVELVGLLDEGLGGI